jgi:hypothetical protein
MEALGKCLPMSVLIGNKTRQGVPPCPSYIEICFSGPGPLQYVIFQNYYTSSISIKQLNETTSAWKTILRDYKLTHHPHFENDAENWFILSTSLFNSNYRPHALSKMRIYLTQPSPNWVDNTLRNIKCYKVTIEAAAESEPPKHSFEVFRKKIKDNLDSLSATEGNKMSTV